MPKNLQDQAEISQSLRAKTVQFRKMVLAWAEENLRSYPWRKPERSPYDVLLAEVLLKRTTASAVLRVYEDILERFPTVLDLAGVSEDELASAISSVGLQKQRARALRKMTTYLMNEHGGNIPNELEALRRTPGVGEYSARALLSFAFNIPVAILDTNVERVLHRVFQGTLPPKSSQQFLQEVADTLLPGLRHRAYNWALLDIGALICRYVDPRCVDCPLNSICDYHNKKYKLPKGRTPRPGQLPGLQQIRRSKKISLRQLADKAGVSKLTIINIEAGRTTPLQNTIQKLAAALEVAPNDLVKDPKKPGRRIGQHPQVRGQPQSQPSQEGAGHEGR